MNAYEAMRAARPRAIRSYTLGERDIRRHLRVIAPEPTEPEPEWRPKTRGDCAGVPRPCPYISCAHNLYLDVSRAGGIKLNFPDLEPEDMPADSSCSLDIAERGPSSDIQIGAAMNITRERARQLSMSAESKLVRVPALKRLFLELSK
jgi:hypothetical protein